MKNYVRAYYDSESGLEVNFFDTLQEAYDYMIQELEEWYEDLYAFPTIDELVERWDRDDIKEWQSEDSFIRYNMNCDKVYGYVCDNDTYTFFEIVSSR